MGVARLAKAESAQEAAETEIVDQDAIAQVERLEAMLLATGTASDRNFEKKAQRILKNLGELKNFEEGQRELGELLGFIVGNDELDAAPDPWWLGEIASSITKRGTKNHSRGTIGLPKRSLISMLRRAGSKNLWI